MHDTPPSVPDFTQWPSFPFEGELRVKPLDEPVPVEPPRKGEGDRECTACQAPDDAYIWVGERWRVRAMDRPTGLPMVLILESRSHLDLGDLPNLLAAELGVMTVRLERAIRSLDDVARVHVNRWGDGSAHLHMWFLARPYGRLQLRGTFLSLWDSILPPISEDKWRENLALVAAWLAEFGGRPLAEPPRIQWQAPSSLTAQSESVVAERAPQSGSLLDAIGETAEPPDADASDAGKEPSSDAGPSSETDAVRSFRTDAAPSSRTGAAPSNPIETAAAAIVGQVPRPTPDRVGEEAEAELVVSVPGHQGGVAGSPEADAVVAAEKPEVDVAGTRGPVDSPNTEVNATSRDQGAEPAGATGSPADEVTGPTDGSSDT